MRNQPAHKTTNEIENEIAQTRAELDSTLDQIGRRLSPTEMKERAVEYVKNAADSVSETVQRNPATIAVTGTVLLATALARHRSRSRRARLSEEQLRALWERISGVIESRARSRRMPAELPSASHVVSGLRDGLVKAIDGAATQRFGAVAGEGAKRLMATIEQGSREQPLLALAAAAVVGATLASLLRR